VINLGGVTGLMPVTGLTLPFFSSGGSSLFASMVAVGLLLGVARRIGSRPVAEEATP
jgi:cell division protein FtsW